MPITRFCRRKLSLPKSRVTQDISGTGNAVVAGTLEVTGATTLDTTLAVTGAAALSSTLTWKPLVQACAGGTDAVLFSSALNVAIFTSTGPDAATLATPGAGDVGKILLLVNTNTTQNVVTTAAGILTNGTATTYLHLTAPAHAGAVAVLVAQNGFWDVVNLGTGTWVLS
jgi:hypothetical protein